MSTDAQTKGTDAQPLEQIDVWVAVSTGGFGDGGKPRKVRRTAKLLGHELGARPACTTARGPAVHATPDEAGEIRDGDLIVAPGPQVATLRAGNGHPWRVAGRAEPVELGGESERGLPRGTYVPLLVKTALEAADAVDEPPVGTAAPAPVEHPERPLVDPGVWRSEEQVHHMKQHSRWEDAWRRMDERQKARALEFLELDVLWEQLDSEERDKAVKAVQEPRRSLPCSRWSTKRSTRGRTRQGERGSCAPVARQ